ncbi:hypothetical protein [Clostridium uliginosum]|uniref:Uncharacterized protein n=1 Tax=Clostridium uliginosum TaxID=119641 RepID=A0A1I1QPQ0_9CLOT|nr:hypothetical protein [Clostridium uliginosum]SFD24029.1 hypothetical protein SAMN05421842_12632 [Clostridium uliginosum]
MSGAGISHNIIVNMYTKKPEINENGDMVFKKNGLFLLCGILLVLIFSLCAVFMDYYVVEIMEENNINKDMLDTLYICGYSLTALFMLIGMKLIIMFFKCKIIVSKDAITSKKIFSSKTIKLLDIEMITFSNAKGLVFKSCDSKIAFGNFTIGLIEMLKFIEANTLKYKCETAILKAKKMLSNNRIFY